MCKEGDAEVSASPPRSLEWHWVELTFRRLASTADLVGIWDTLVGLPSASTGTTAAAFAGAGVALSGDEEENENAWVAA